MATERTAAVPLGPQNEWRLTRLASFSRLRVLAWDGDVLFASRGYTLMRARITGAAIDWQVVGRFRPPWWRNLTASTKLASRLFRDGLHALAVLPSGHLVAAVPGAIITLAPGETEFRASHRVLRGTRPLHIAATPDGRVFWGEYFDNAQRAPVHIYASQDRGATWDIAHTFAQGEIRHVHNIVYDEWENCLWILTGDNGSECRILRASCDLRQIDVVMSGNQQARAVAMVSTRDALYFSSDTPLEKNHVYRLDRTGKLTELASLSSSSIYGCGVGGAVFFSTMVEPSEINRERNTVVYGSRDGTLWQRLLEWKKDRWPMGLFQYGNVILPDGKNASPFLAATTVAVENDDLTTTIWHV